MMTRRSRNLFHPWLSANRNLVLFSALLLTVLLLPAYEDTPVGERTLAAACAGIVVVSVVVNGRSRVFFWLSLLFSIAAVTLRFAAFFDGFASLLGWSWVFTAAVLTVTMIRLLQDLFAPGAVGRDRLFGCATVYLLIGLVWCFIFAIIEEAAPGSFSGMGDSKTVHIADFTFFSFNIVTNVALTNGMPVSRTAQVSVLLQEFISVLYMAFVISRLVGMYTPTAAAPAPQKDSQ